MKHILIDYENIQPKSFDHAENNCHVWLFLGVNQQKNLPLELVETLLKFDNDKVHIIKMQHSGKNALDFYLSFYLGKISEIDSKADVCILAKDSGYDILVEHLNSSYDGMTIKRTADTSQLALSYEAVKNTAPNAELLVTQKNQKILDNGLNQIAPDHETALHLTTEHNVASVVIHDCYLAVFDNIVNRNVFLPSYKGNLLYQMEKYIPNEILQRFNSAEQNQILEQVFEKFAKAGLIRFDEDNKKLVYKVDNQGILELVTEKVLVSKAKTITGLKNVIKQKLASYRQLNDEAQINLVITWLKKQGFIKQNGQNICYINLDNHESVCKAEISNTIYQQAIAAIQAHPIKSRPAKKSTLINYFNSRLCNNDSKMIDYCVEKMVANKVIVISSSNKVSYNI